MQNAVIKDIFDGFNDYLNKEQELREVSVGSRLVLRVSPSVRVCKTALTNVPFPSSKSAK